MRRIALPTLTALLALPLVAGEAQRAKIQLFGEQTSFHLSPVLFVIEGGQTYTTQDRPKDQTSWGLRLSIGLDDEAKWNFELAVRAKKKSPFTYSGPVSPSLNVNFTQDGLEYGWWGPGFSYALRLGPVLTLNTGLDFRVERITYFLPAGCGRGRGILRNHHLRQTLGPDGSHLHDSRFCTDQAPDRRRRRCGAGPQEGQHLLGHPVRGPRGRAPRFGAERLTELLRGHQFLILSTRRRAVAETCGDPYKTKPRADSRGFSCECGGSTVRRALRPPARCGRCVPWRGVWSS